MGKIIGLTFEDVPKITCPHCNKGFKSVEALEKHIAEKHLEENKNQSNGANE